MIVIIFRLDSIEHANLIFIRGIELITKKLLMELLIGYKQLLLVTEDHLLGGNTDRQLEFESLFLLFFSKQLSLFTVGHEPARPRLLEHIVDRVKLHGGHLDDDLELLIVHDLLHVWHELMLLVSLYLNLFPVVNLDRLFELTIQDLAARTL